MDLAGVISPGAFRRKVPPVSELDDQILPSWRWLDLESPVDRASPQLTIPHFFLSYFSSSRGGIA